MIGECTGKPARRAQTLGWGRMWVARGRNIYTYPGEPWGLDNGAFRDWADGIPFDGDQFQTVLDKAVKVGVPYLAVLPDIPGGGEASLELSMNYLGRVPREYPWYLAVQDGMEPADVDPDGLAGIFLGGTNAYKARASEWRRWAHSRNLKFHYGRCGTLRKLAHAIEVSADSIDSAFPMWTRARWEAFKEAVTCGPPQGDMFYGQESCSVLPTTLGGKG
jgi:hypothetical protein